MLSAAETGWRETNQQDCEGERRVRGDGRDPTLPGRCLLEGRDAARCVFPLPNVLTRQFSANWQLRPDAACCVSNRAENWSLCFSHTARAESTIRVVARKTIGHHTLLRDAADGLKPWKETES